MSQHFYICLTKINKYIHTHTRTFMACLVFGYSPVLSFVCRRYVLCAGDIIKTVNFFVFKDLVFVISKTNPLLHICRLFVYFWINKLILNCKNKRTHTHIHNFHIYLQNNHNSNYNFLWITKPSSEVWLSVLVYTWNYFLKMVLRSFNWLYCLQ